MIADLWIGIFLGEEKMAKNLSDNDHLWHYTTHEG